MNSTRSWLAALLAVIGTCLMAFAFLRVLEGSLARVSRMLSQTVAETVKVMLPPVEEQTPVPQAQTWSYRTEPTPNEDPDELPSWAVGMTPEEYAAYMEGSMVDPLTGRILE